MKNVPERFFTASGMILLMAGLAATVYDVTIGIKGWWTTWGLIALVGSFAAVAAQFQIKMQRRGYFLPQPPTDDATAKDEVE